MLGPVLATYTAVLAADTAVPAWHGAHRELPYLFAASATAAAAGMALVTGPAHENTPAPVAVTYRDGRAGRLMRAARALTAAGAAGAVLLGHRSRPAAAVAGLALLAGSACTRFGVFHAGIASAEDPAHTVGPQREAAERRRTSLSQ